VDKGRQEGPHAHSINPALDNRFAFAADLGLDKILIYKLDAAKATLTPNEPAFAATVAGGGPRHFAFHPSGKYAFVCNEMKSSITSFDYNADKGELKQRQTLSTLPEGYDKPGNSTAEVQVHPSGKFVYVSNRGHDSIAGYTIADDGQIASIGQTSIGGKTPRNFGIDPTGKYLVACGQSSGSVHVFKIDQKTGKLEVVGAKVDVPNPVCVKFLKQ
jgi:6-phosphogluconolactonase